MPPEAGFSMRCEAPQAHRANAVVVCGVRHDDLQRMNQDDRRPDEHLLHADLTHAILGGFYAVHTALGSGFLESVYVNALEFELRSAGMRVEREVPFKIHYRGHLVGACKADMVVADKVVVETKSARLIDPAHLAQLHNYLRASTLQVGCC